MPSSSPITTVWPARILPVERLPLDTGHGSFCLHQTYVGDEAFSDRRVQLACNLLIIVRRGAVILERDGSSVLLQEGDGALIAPSEFQITEIPRPQTTHGEILFFFFSDAVLGDCLRNKGEIDEHSARIALPVLPFYPVRRFNRTIDAASAVNPLSPPTEFSRIFTFLLNSSGSMIFCFLKHVYFVRRFKLDLFLETHFLNTPSIKDLEDHYPDGAQAFRRECAIYLGMKVSQWRFRRRMELAYAWIRYGQHELEEIARVLGYRDMRVFRGNVESHFRISVDDLYSLRLFSGLRFADLQHSGTPFWFPSNEARRFTHEARTFDWFELNMCGNLKEDLKKYRQERIRETSKAAEPYLGQAVPIQTTIEPSIENFLSLKTTRIDSVISLEAVENWQAGKGPLVYSHGFDDMAA